jgi:protein dithiol oxidoreductase (disulfide-forming)
MRSDTPGFRTMQRRDFSFSAAGTAALALTGAGLGASSLSRAQGKTPKEGVDYLTLSKPATTEAAAGKVEVVEFFWYSCPHCNRFEPQFDAWTKKGGGKNVAVRRAPVAFRADFEPQQRLYYVLESMGKVDELHAKVFNAIHNEKLPLANAEQIATWAERNGIDKAKFIEAYNSFPVVTKVRKATQLQDMYQVDGVPALGIGGRYFTSGSLAGSMENALVVTDYLVGLSRKSA